MNATGEAEPSAPEASRYLTRVRHDEAMTDSRRVGRARLQWRHQPAARGSDWVTALVTGAASGIGQHLSQQLAEVSQLVLVDKDPVGLQTLASGIGDTAVPQVVDLSDRAALRVACEGWKASIPRLDLLVLNAGIGLVGEVSQIDEADLDHLLDVNLRAPLVMAAALLPAVVVAQGRIVVMSSISGALGTAGQSVYAATKAGLRAYAESLDAEVASLGVSVTTVLAGGVRTEMARNVRGAAGATDEQLIANEELAERLLTRDPATVAARILAGAAARRRRVLIGADTRAADAVIRLSPRLAARLAAGLAKVVSSGPKP